VHRTLLPAAKPLAWSPDGRLLALVRDQDTNLVLWLSVPDSGSLRPLTRISGGFVLHHIVTAKWAPDGRDLLYEVRGGPNSFPLYLARAALDGSFDGSENFGSSGDLACQARMQEGTAPDWSPDGSEIVAHRPVYQGGTLYLPGLYVLNREGTEQRFLVTGQQPDWSPDGSAIVYVAGLSSCRGGDSERVLRYASSSLHLISPDGGNDRQLTSPAQDETDENPAWSPDGSRIAFLRLGIGPDSVVTSVHAYLVDADGSNEHELAMLPQGSVSSMPSWSPDGLYLAFAGAAGTYVVNADGSDFHMVSGVFTCCVPAQWRP
jgi:Tol biopolymer transport system component